MRDIFDEFMDELRRRQAGPGSSGTGRGDGSSDDDGPGDAPEEPGEDEAPRRPQPVRRRAAGRRGTGGRSGLRIWLVVIAAVAIVLFLSTGLGLWTDAIWYRSVGFDAVFWTRLGAGAGLFALGLALGLVVLLGNLWLAGRLAPPPDPTRTSGLREFLERMNETSFSGMERRGPRPVNAAPPPELPDLGPIVTVALAGLAVFAAFIAGAAVSGERDTVLLWLNRVPFAPAGGAPVTDPIFGRDISFFLFDLPFLRAVQALFNGLVIGALVVAFGRYLAGGAGNGFLFSTPVRLHLAILGGLFLVSVALGYQLDKLELVYSTRGVATGVSYTDQNAQFLAYDVLTVLSAFAAAFLVGGALTRWTWPLGMTVVAWFLASLVIGRLYPEAVQRLTVAPNQFAQEERYISNNIAMTRLAYGINSWEEKPYGGERPLTADQITTDAATFQNARLWDYRPLGLTLGQLQTVRRYYTFPDVDTDRYQIDGATRQVMLSARELDLAGNPSATGWVNQRVIYTHGIGLVMVPVNEVTTEGQPVLYIKNLPPVSSAGAPTVTQARIYFGEAPTGYVVVGARQDEFDYPSGDPSGAGADVGERTRWTGTSGIKLDTLFSRLLFAARFGDLDLLISDQVTDQSQLLMYRSLDERLQLLAPFLRYDKDPYLVVTSSGRLVYVQDAYTVSDRFPQATPFDPATLAGTGLGTQPFNYIRNSVKVVMDAYDGSMSFYVTDPSDPIIRAWQGAYPTLFKPADQMPSDIKAHLRVPEELFNVETHMYGRYHVTDPETFFRNDDEWRVPAGQTNVQSLPSEAYYVVMRMPGEPNPEFLLLQPMVPVNRPNMIAWVAARMDAPNYGAVRVYRFPSDTTIFGPEQIEARIDQDPTISAQITLWNQSGSSVVRGNLIVVPVGDSLIYLQPVYLQSTSSKFPEFQRIVVATPTTVVWGRTLDEALKLILTANGTPAPTPTPSTGPTPTPSPSATPSPSGELPSDVAGLIAYANQHFELAQQALRNGNFAQYGQEIDLVRQALARLDALAGPTPTP